MNLTFLSPRPTRRGPVPWFLLSAGGLLLLGPTGCNAPDVPPALAEELPKEGWEFLQPDDIRAVSVGDGLAYRKVRSGQGPWEIHLLEVDLSDCRMGLKVVSGSSGEGRWRVVDLLDEVGPTALAGVNGDFFTPEGRPAGVEASGGALRSGGSRPVLGWRPGEDPWIGSVEWTGDTVRIGRWTLVSGRADGVTEVIGGFPVLLTDGEEVDGPLGGSPEFSEGRHPRTAVGFDSENTVLWIAVVEGRRGGSSLGMTLEELRTLMKSLGAREAINLDGGGSSVMVLGRRAVSRTAQLGGEREVANALAVVRDPVLCRLAGVDVPDGEPGR